MLLYLRQEGRGIGLLNKIRAYNLQDSGMDTVEANEHLGFDADLRSYDICKLMLDTLNVKHVELMTNNPKKLAALKALGIDVVARKPIDHGIIDEFLKNAHTNVGVFYSAWVNHRLVITYTDLPFSARKAVAHALRRMYAVERQPCTCFCVNAAIF